MEWHPVVGWEGLYEVSDVGDVQSLDRIVVLSTGQRQLRRGRLMRTHPNGPGGHLKVWLTRRAGQRSHRYVHDLVLEAFVGLRPPGLKGLHWDDDAANNAVSNLRWGTTSDNQHDCIRNGNHVQARKTHCGICGAKLITTSWGRRCPNRYYHSSQYVGVSQ